jgi:ribosomal protein L3 glutamine methyltransferase
LTRGRARQTSVAGSLRDIERRFRGARLFYGHGTHDAREEAAWLVCHVLRIPFDRLGDAPERVVAPIHARRLAALADRRIRTREPLAYVLREAWLQHRRFYVDRRVIVPRSHIAELLPDGLSAWLPARGPRRILDLCTGSGCLAILAALAFPQARVDATDVSAGALAVARRNVAAHRLTRRVRLVRSDLFAGLGESRFDLILCNPPYVPDAAMQRLPAEYRHEPRLALASGRDGLDFVRRLLGAAPEHLAPRGLLVVEVGDGRAALERAFPLLEVTWLETAAGPDLVFAVTREALGRMRSLRSFPRPA